MQCFYGFAKCRRLFPCQVIGYAAVLGGDRLHRHGVQHLPGLTGLLTGQRDCLAGAVILLAAVILLSSIKVLFAAVGGRGTVHQPVVGGIRAVGFLLHLRSGTVRAYGVLTAHPGHDQRDGHGDHRAGGQRRQDLLIRLFSCLILGSTVHLLHEPGRKILCGFGVRCQRLPQQLFQYVVFPFFPVHGCTSFPCCSVCMTLAAPKRFPLRDKIPFSCALARFSRDFTVPAGSFSVWPISS